MEKNVKNNPDRNPLESNNILNGLTMNDFPNILEEAILTWEKNMRRKLNNKFFCGYRELSILVGLAPSTLRSYTDEFTPKFPTLLSLTQICAVINDLRPIEFYFEYTKSVVNK
jgi:hypothetical protein